MEVSQVITISSSLVLALSGAVVFLYLRMEKRLDQAEKELAAERKAAREAWESHTRYIEEKADRFYEIAKSQGAIAEVLNGRVRR